MTETTDTPAPLHLNSATADPQTLGAVVGVGGSAGSLLAFERFFTGLPSGSHMSFVVVSHLDPAKPSMMPELLQRCTLLPVVVITDGLPLQTDHVYVAPPGFSVSIMHGTLLLEALEGTRGKVIDAFFTSLAADQRERAVGVVLSGMGQDGTQGLHAIKAHGGLALAQDPESAEFSSMPQSAVASGLVDQVLSAEELAAYLYERFANDHLLDPEALVASHGTAELSKILLLIRSRLGHDFTQYKPSTLLRRIDRRLKSHRLQGLSVYLKFLQEHPEELEALFHDLTINVTSFFRDPDAFVHLKEQVRLMLVSEPQESLRAWVAGCASGEEAYSVAMVLQELRDEIGASFTVQVFATDIDPASIRSARTGLYPHSIEQVVSEDRLQRFFQRIDAGYQIRSVIRESVVFALHNTFSDPPFTRLELVCCRNMMIYLKPDLQQQILSVFHYALQPGGLLFLGTSESLGEEGAHFTALDRHWRIYRRGNDRARPLLSGPISLRGREVSSPPGRSAVPALLPKQGGMSGLIQRTLLQQFAPPAVVVNAAGDIMFAHGRTGRYLELPSGASGTNNVLNMVRDGLRYELTRALEMVRRDHHELTLQSLNAETDEHLRLTLRPLNVAEQRLILISFHDVAPTDVNEGIPVTQLDELRALRHELLDSREALHANSEEMMISVEELRSTNEEYQTTIEELKSTNEELMTSKEELQSLNEELITTNSEHQRMITDLGQANDDMKNLLESAGIATLFLSNDLKIKRFTPKVTGVIRLLPGDLGRPISDFSSGLQYPQFLRDLQQVVDTLTPQDVQVQAQDGTWYALRISPYRTSDNFIDGVVVTLTHIGAVKTLEAELVKSLLPAEALLTHMPDAMGVFDQQLRLIVGNQPLYTLLRTTAVRARGEQLAHLGNDPLQLAEIQQRLDDVVLTEVALRAYLTDLDVPGVGRQPFKVEAWPAVSDDGQHAVYLLLLENLSGVVPWLVHNNPDDGSTPQGAS